MTSRKLVLPSKLTEVSEVVMILINMVVIISPPIIHTTPRSFPGIVFGALSPYLKKKYILSLRSDFDCQVQVGQSEGRILVSA